MVSVVTEHNVDHLTPMINNRLITVITIFLNAERFIEEAIQSVLAQSYREWELLLVDDGSTDRSTNIARRFAELYPERIRYFDHSNHENRGMSASRNLGLRKAQGDYIAFLDSDDVWLPLKLEQQLEILDSHPEAAMVYGATQYWYSWTGESADAERDFVPDPGIESDRLVRPPKLVRALLQNQIVTSTGCLARRSVVQEVGGYEEDFRGLFEDQVFHSKISIKSPVFVSSQCWYKYRRHSGSCCSVIEREGDIHAERLHFLDWLEAYSMEQGVDDKDLRLALRNEKWKSRHPAMSRYADHAQYRAGILKERLKSVARRALPISIYRWLKKRLGASDHPIPFGQVSFGDLRRQTPISRVFGFDRGTPVDRYYIERFLAAHADDIQGRVLEVGDDAYTRRFGGNRTTTRDVLHVSSQNPVATIVADLASAEHIPSDTFDCIILTQTLHLIYEIRNAISTLHRILKPNGVLLATVPGISQIDHYDWGGSWYWAFTSHSAKRLFEEAFSHKNVEVKTHGNVLAATAFLHGIAMEELTEDELDCHDSDYQVIIAVRAMKEP